VALRDIKACFITCQKGVMCDRRNIFASFSQNDVHFLGRHALWRPPACSASDVLCYVLFADCIVPATSSGDNAQILWQAWHFVTCDEN